ncbi:MAG: TonB-dependent receptor [Alistipes ihumii]
MHKLLVPILLTLAAVCRLYGATESYPVSGRVIDRLTRQPVPFAAVVISGQPGKGAIADSAGKFTIAQVKPGIYRLSASMLGYRSALTSEYIVSGRHAVHRNRARKRSAGNRNGHGHALSRPPHGRKSGQRPNDRVARNREKPGFEPRHRPHRTLPIPSLVFARRLPQRPDRARRRPPENRFFMDGIEIPNINHFATQGASGGPVSLVNSDLIREIDFYTGAFPADRAGALSSVLDFRLRDGDPDRQRFRATLGASEVGLSGSGHIGEKATFLFSARQSYLQMLFKLLGLPFLPNYIDAQAKVRIRFSQRDELTVLALAGIDNMRLNTDEKGEETEYLLSYLPRLRQETFTVGASYRHYAGRHAQTVTLSHSYLNNRNTKYLGNDESSEDNRPAPRPSSRKRRCGPRTARTRTLDAARGVELSYSHYTNRTFRRFFAEQAGTLNYRTRLGLTGWGAFVAADYASADDRLTVSAGIGPTGATLAETARPWHQLSPRASVRYALSERWTVAASAGLYYQLPPFTALGFENGQGKRVNRRLKYMRVAETSAGFDWRLRDRLTVSIEGFHKFYTGVPLSLADSIPLTCQGNDYGTVGDEPLAPTAEGRAYGVEAMVRWQIPNRLHVVGSVTVYRSEYRSGRRARYIASAWDNRFVLNLSGTYELPKAWSIGAKLSAIGGAPYTPYDTEKSSLKEAWDARGRPYYDYSRYNEGRLPAFAQLDLRIDKAFYFRRCTLGIYVDLQNVTGSKLRQPDVLMSTGIVENPSAPASEQRYRMKYIKQESGTLVPALGVTVEF